MNIPSLIRLLEAEAAGPQPDPTQPKSPETKAIPWAAQHYPGSGPRNPDAAYPRKNPEHVL